MNGKFEEVRKRSEDLKRSTFQNLWLETVECSTLFKSLVKVERRPWLADVVHEMFEQQDGKCALTGEPLEVGFEVDHIVPHSYGGGNERGNIRLVNRGPNRSRGNRGISPHDLLRYLEDRYMNR